MSFLANLLELITSQPGALVYHLVTLFAIQLILGVAIGHWQRRRDESSTRVLVVGIGFFLARAILMLVAALDRAALWSSDLVLPPLERFLDLVTLLLVAWAFLPILGQSPGQNAQLGTPLLVVTILVAVGAYAAFATLWPDAAAQGLAYNGYWQERVWEVSTTATLGLALIASVAWRGPDWGWLFCLLSLWLAGHSLQLVAPVTGSDSAAWVRLANLAALPLLAGLVYRRALDIPAAEEGEDTALGTVGMLKAIQRIEKDGNAESALELAATSIARAVQADMVAIGLPISGSTDVLRITALHPTTSAVFLNQELTVQVSKHAPLTAALQPPHAERFLAASDVSKAADLYRSLGFDAAGPLLIQPLNAGERVLGVVLVGNPNSKRAWRARDEEIVEAMGGALASAMASERQQEVLVDRALERSREEAQRMTERIGELEARLDRQRERAEELSTRLRLQE